MDIQQYLSKRRNIINKALIRYLPKGNKYSKLLGNAVRYSVMSGGKRIRPILALAACEAVSGSYKKAIPVAAAIEMIHTYTLIHDDLPAMDNDDMRRGKPTCHKVFGEDAAILAGDMLNTLAFEVIAGNCGDRSARIISELSKALGINGVVGGQMLDLRSRDGKIGLAELNYISLHKTADLFIASVRCGAIAGSAKSPVISKLTAYARHLGLAFQIIDDILDYRQGSRNNYPALIGMDKANELAGAEVRKALMSLPGGSNFKVFKDIALFLAERKD